jgi:ABC-type Mn2+/Zn2+ transport system permease subunit
VFSVVGITALIAAILLLPTRADGWKLVLNFVFGVSVAAILCEYFDYTITATGGPAAIVALSVALLAGMLGDEPPMNPSVELGLVLAAGLAFGVTWIVWRGKRRLGSTDE